MIKLPAQTYAVLAALSLLSSVALAWVSLRLYNRGNFTLPVDIAALGALFMASMFFFAAKGWL